MKTITQLLTKYGEIFSVVFLLLLWEFIYIIRIFDKSLFPSAFQILESLFNLFKEKAIYNDIGFTLLRMLIGYTGAAVFGVFLGLLIGSSRIMYKITIPLIDFGRSVPVTTLYPIFVLTLGIGDDSKAAMIFTACTFVVSLNTAYGISLSSKTRTTMAKLFGASKTRIFLWIKLFEALPQIFVGLRVTLSLALIVVILTEMFMGANLGLGQKLTEAYTTFAMTEVYSLVLLTGLIGFIFNKIFVVIENRLLPWVGK